MGSINDKLNPLIRMYKHCIYPFVFIYQTIVYELVSDYNYYILLFTRYIWIDSLYIYEQTLKVFY